MVLSDIIAGTVGGKDWQYKNASPLMMGITVESVWPVFAIIPVIKEELYSYGNYDDYLLAQIKKYCEVTLSNEIWTLLTKSTYPRHNIKSYKLAYLKETEVDYAGWMDLYCYDGVEVRPCRYNDIEIPGLFAYELAEVFGACEAIGNYNLDRGLINDSDEDYVRFYFRQEEKIGIEFTNSLPVFYSRENLENYLRSEDPDPTNFGGVFAINDYTYGGDEVPEEDFNTPGNSIEGIGEDLGLDLSTGPVRAIVLSDENLEKLGEIISGGWFSGNIGDAIISIKKIRTPLPIETTTDADIGITLAGATAPTLPGKYIKKQFQEFSFGTYTINENFNSFIDYTNTTVSLYLPFSGLHQLETKTIIGSTISLKCYIDYISGSITWYVNVERNGISQVIYEFTGICSMDFPITAIDYAQKITQAVTGIIGLGSSILLGGGSGLSVGGMEGIPIVETASVASLAKSIDTNYITVGNLQSNFGWTGIMYPYLIFSRSKVNYPENYGKNYGFPSMKNARLGDLTGFTQVSEIHLDDINCLDEEKQDLYNLLKSGVIL